MSTSTLPTSIKNIEKRASDSLPELSTPSEAYVKNEEHSRVIIPDPKQIVQRVESTSTAGSLKTGPKEADDDSIAINPQEEISPLVDGVEIPDDRDVLSGRGAGVNLHPGNVYFRRLIQTNEQEYVKADPGGKKRLIRNIVQSVTEDRRFLKYDHDKELWIRLSAEEIKKKVGQALREKAPAIKKEQNLKLFKKSLELQRNQLATTHGRVSNLMIPPLQYSPSVQPVVSSQFLSPHQPRPQQYSSIRGLLSQMNQLQEKQIDLKRKQREIEDEQSQLIQHIYQITASLSQEMSSVDLLLGAASNNDSRFLDTYSKNDFSRDPKKRRVTPPSHNFYS